MRHKAPRGSRLARNDDDDGRTFEKRSVRSNFHGYCAALQIRPWVSVGGGESRSAHGGAALRLPSSDSFVTRLRRSEKSKGKFVD